ncbi:PREDICTED: reticuline oxidase-like protein [Tarenaya hassleriana]|uniref:reticuline oxidase-like protein n=1 Tax=Tarenaya hassleriana TaxID=28532 RepID=UPI00053C96E7|nr:PREDICTED: reticuline oxidase-like protein [Tarenaya hassleriana]
MEKISTLQKILAFSLLSFFTASYVTSQITPPDFLRCLDRQPSDPTSPNSAAAYIPSNASFSAVLRRRIPNLRFDKPTTPKPIAVVAAATWTHLPAALGCSRELGIQVRIRSGGHDFEGLSYISNVPFYVLDMFNFRSVDVNLTEASAWVDSGVTIGELCYRIAEKTKVYGFPAGLYPTLGVGGHFSGGGYGNLMRKYGLSVDNVVGSGIVDSNGNIYTDRVSMGENVFWAIRGGGGASFGIVLGYRIRLVPVPEKVTVFNVSRTVEDGASDLVWKWQEFAYKTDRNLFVRLTLTPVNGKRAGEKTVLASFVGMYLGRSDGVVSILNRGLPELRLKKTDCTEMSWIESVVFWAGYPIGTPTSVLLNREPPKLFMKRKSDYVKNPISKPGIDAILKKLTEIEKVKMVWNPYGGRMSEIPETRTPFPHRSGNVFNVEYVVDWSESGDDAEKDHVERARKMHEFMTPYVSTNPREAFLNYRDLDVGSNVNFTYEEGKVFGVKYFKNNFERLVDVKSRFDPDNFYRNEQSIPVRK